MFDFNISNIPILGDGYPKISGLLQKTQPCPTHNGSLLFHSDPLNGLQYSAQLLRPEFLDDLGREDEAEAEDTRPRELLALPALFDLWDLQFS